MEKENALEDDYDIKVGKIKLIFEMKRKRHLDIVEEE